MYLLNTIFLISIITLFNNNDKIYCSFQPTSESNFNLKRSISKTGESHISSDSIEANTRRKSLQFIISKVDIDSNSDPNLNLSPGQHGFSKIPIILAAHAQISLPSNKAEKAKKTFQNLLNH